MIVPAENEPRLLAETRAFWDRNPCDGHPEIEGRLRFRYRKEPWLPRVLDQVAAHTNVLEVGCGQGTDALYCCMRMHAHASYTGVDLSSASIESAARSARTLAGNLKVQPDFRFANAEKLDFPDGAFQCVASFGVLHHTANTERGISEIHRVLQVGGTAYISLYRLLSPKLLAAYTLRGGGWLVDKVAGRKGWACDMMRKASGQSFLGTMVLECLGVPIMRSYTKSQIRRLFGAFQIRSIVPVGMGFPFLGFNHLVDKGKNPLGAEWLVVATKSPTHCDDQVCQDNPQ
jgi:SAM-dependent methyltransferase